MAANYSGKSTLVDFEVGERVAWISANNELCYGTVCDADPLDADRIPIKDENGFVARPTADRVAKLSLKHPGRN